MNLSSILADKAISEEIKNRIKKGAYSPLFPINNRDLTIEFIDRVSSGESLPSSYEIEAIVLAVGRPALIIKDGTFSYAESDFWTELLNKNKQKIENVIPSVGRIELKNHPGFEWIGTGWVVKNNIVVTNRHVANEFSIKDKNNSFRFRINYEGKEIGARVDLREEYLQSKEEEFKVTKILYIAEPEEPDIAFLEVEFSGNILPQPITLSDKVESDSYVFAIGYPAWDGKRNDPAVMKSVFNDVYGVKRLQPGKVLSVHEKFFTHDCSTLGGNSGSVLVSLETGSAVGLHFAGTYRKENLAVPANIIQSLLSNI